MRLSNKIDVQKAQYEIRRLVVLIDIAAPYMLDPDYAEESRQDTLDYLAGQLVSQALAVESALDAAPVPRENQAEL